MMKFSAGIAALFAIFFAPVAGAQPVDVWTAQLPDSDNPFSALVGKPRQRRAAKEERIAIERYVLASDDRAFLFEDRANKARLKFLCGPDDLRIDCILDPFGPAPEIYELFVNRGPRGDIIYKNTSGDTMLRIASYGGATVYWPGDAGGAAASKSFGDDRPLTLQPATFGDAQRRAAAAGALISDRVAGSVIFDIGRLRADEADATVLADAVMVAAKGVARVADDPIGAQAITEKVARVRFLPDAVPGIALNNRVLIIQYAPDGDLSGRPSSASIIRFLEETL